MKKFVLFAAMAAMVCGNLFAKTDGQTYEAVNGINMANVWILDRVHSGDDWSRLDACNTRARTGVLAGDVVYISRSEAKAIIQNGDTLGSASVIYRFDAKTGAQLPDLDVTLDGSPYMVFLGVNSIGVDNFGHLWIAPYTSETAATIPFYSLDPETGALTKLATLEKTVVKRTDYYDVMGDITLKEAGCRIMTAAAVESGIVYRWSVEKGDTWDDVEGGFEGDTYLDITDFYPESITMWSYGPTVKMCYDPEADDPYAGELFYVDGFQSQPILYSTDGSMIDNFEGVDPELYQYEVGANGCAEFTLNGRNFLVYTVAQYSGYDEKTEHNRYCQANICELGEGQEIETMQKYWTVPANGLGEVSDGGNRVHCFNVQYATEDGEEVVYLFDFKCYNGMGVYKIGKNV